jgi:2-dehydropantoate 2-reductase
MRFIVYGAGAVGGVVGGRLFEAGHEVVLIARGRHLQAIKDGGLTLQSPGRSARLPISAVGAPAEITFLPGDLVLFAMKTNDTEAAVAELVLAAGPEIPVACLQNGVESERMAARRLANVYAVPVRLPATHMEPGIVVADSGPITGILDIGRYPRGVDALCEEAAAAFESATFSARPVATIMRDKYRKLVGMNLSNAAQAVCGPGPAIGPIVRRAQQEAEECMAAAGIDIASAEEDRERRGNLITVQPVEGKPRGGSSTWQSLARGKQVLEVDYLNGEIVLLGHLHGIATPVNAALQFVANGMAANGDPPGSMSVEELEAAIGR